MVRVQDRHSSAEGDSHRTALNSTEQQRDFIAQHNACFGRRGYDLRQALAERVDQLNAMVKGRHLAEGRTRAGLISLNFG